MDALSEQGPSRQPVMNMKLRGEMHLYFKPLRFWTLFLMWYNPAYGDRYSPHKNILGNMVTYPQQQPLKYFKSILKRSMV